MTRQFDSLLIDANCLLNLYATGRLRDIVYALPYQFWVADFVVEREALFVWRRSTVDGEDVKEPVDLTLLIDEGLIQLMRLDKTKEEATFVALAAELDDGEAVTGALAFHRGCAVATDDRKARRVLGQLSPPVELVSTLELLKRWGKEAQVPRDELGAAMAEMQSSASYRPGRRDPLTAPDEWRGHGAQQCAAGFCAWWRSVASHSGI